MKFVGKNDVFTGNEFLRSLSNDFEGGGGLYLYWLPARCFYWPNELGRSMSSLCNWRTTYCGCQYEYMIFDDEELKQANKYTFEDIYRDKNLFEMFKKWDDWADFALKIINERTLNRILFEPYECPRCHGHLVKKHGSRGDFYGCSNYPNCKYAISNTSYYDNDKEKYQELLDYDRIREAFFGVYGADEFDYKKLEYRFSHEVFVK